MFLPLDNRISANMRLLICNSCILGSKLLSFCTDMAHNDHAVIATKVREILVMMVKKFTSSHKYMADVWMNFTHEHSYVEEGQENITYDPQRRALR